MLHARIRKSFPAAPESAGFALDLELRAAAGITVLFGPSGAGKTLTLDCLAGFVRPRDGRILLDDIILFDGASGVHLPPRARQCGYVFQNYALFPHMTLRENLEFAVERRPRLERHRKVNEMLERFRLSDLAGRRPLELSGGQKQRCSIARALIGGASPGPRILLLDEPAQGLDAPLRVELYALLRQVRAEFGVPMLVVTHSLDECFELGEEMNVLRDGKIVQAGPPRQVLEQPANVEIARLFGFYNVLAAEIRALDPGRNSSRLRYREFDLQGPYFPGRLIGDRVWLCVSPEALSVAQRDGRPGPNRVPAKIERVIDKPLRVRIEFEGDLAVEIPSARFEALRGVKEWLVEFPPESLRIL